MNDKSFSSIPTIIVNIQGSDENDLVYKRLTQQTTLASKIKTLDLRPLQNNIYYTHLDGFEKYGLSALENRKFCYMLLANISRTQWNQCPRKNLQKILILEDIDQSIFSGYLSMLFVSPASSFAYMAKEFLAQTNKKPA